MNFTREPIIETVITPKEGYKLVVRNSKGGGQEEFFVDAVEVIAFGNSCFFRSLEKPKSFLVPVNDYEILEVREARMVLKTTSVERGIKIGGGREAPMKKAQKEEAVIEEAGAAAIAEQKAEKKRERRRYRKRRGKAEQEEEEAEKQESPFPEEGKAEERKPEKPSLIPPPSTLISETITRYKSTELPEKIVVEEQEVEPSSEEDENSEAEELHSDVE